MSLQFDQCFSNNFSSSAVLSASEVKCLTMFTLRASSSNVDDVHFQNYKSLENPESVNHRLDIFESDMIKKEFKVKHTDLP